MPKYIIDLPDELIEIIEAEGYTVQSYFETIVIKPLSDRMVVKLEKIEVAKKRKVIDGAVSEAKEKAKIVEKPPEIIEEEEPIEEKVEIK